MTRSEATVVTEVRDDIARISLNRPERLNAVNPQLIDDLWSALHAIQDEDLGAVILSGHGRAFCAGYDLKHSEEEIGAVEQRERIERLQDITRLIREAPMPVLAAVHGHAVGAGLEFALACDLIVASRDAQLRFPEVSLGLAIGGGVSHTLPHLVGMPRAKQLVLLAETIGAQRAYELGLVNFVVELDQLAETVTSLARKLVSLPRTAVRSAKRCLEFGAQHDLAGTYDFEIDAMLMTGRSPDAAVAASRFRDGAAETGQQTAQCANDR